MMAVAKAGGTANVKGLLLKGIHELDGHIAKNGGSSSSDVGNPVYLSHTVSGQMTLDLPSGNGTVVRVLGYLINYGSTSGKCEIYFNPESTYIERSS
jgi:hypothetical protein